MIRKRLFSVLFLLMMISSLVAENREHLVKPGDTLYSLAKKYGVTVEAIQAANPSIEGTNIPAGMTLIIPGEESVNEKEGKKKAIVFNFGKKKDKDKDKDKDKEMTYFEENATRILDRKNISKAQFAKEMGVAPQNINKLFGTKNIYTLSKISTFLDIPLDVLLYGVRTSKKSIQG